MDTCSRNKRNRKSPLCKYYSNHFGRQDPQMDAAIRGGKVWGGIEYLQSSQWSLPDYLPIIKAKIVAGWWSKLTSQVVRHLANTPSLIKRVEDRLSPLLRGSHSHPWCHRLLWELSYVPLVATPWTVARQAPLSMWFPRQEYWSGLPFPSRGDLPNPVIEPGSPAL